MTAWLKKPAPAGNDGGRPAAPVAKLHPSAVPPEYRPLHKYLNGRYADTVVLTFGQIEDLLGFALPDLARAAPEWWVSAGDDSSPSGHSRSWTEAGRTATPNLDARIVVFERP
jgi:hypothetical protein